MRQSKNRGKFIADSLTVSRGIAAFLMLVFPVFGSLFWFLYIWGGVSDILDGPIARGAGCASHRGEVLDSICDLMFLCACLFKLIPVIHLSWWMWIWTAVIALVKLIHIVLGWVRHHRLEMPHTFWNKATGLCLFLLPILTQWLPMYIPALVTLLLASYAAIQEWNETSVPSSESGKET